MKFIYGYNDTSSYAKHFYKIKASFINEGYERTARNIFNKEDKKYLESLLYDHRYVERFSHLTCIPNGSAHDVIKDIKRLGIFEFFMTYNEVALCANEEVKKEVLNWEEEFNLIHKNAEIYPGAYIEPGAKIMENAVISEEAIIEKNAVIKSGIICNAYVKSGAIVDVGHNCVRGIIKK
jgi:hypothetical protein